MTPGIRRRGVARVRTALKTNYFGALRSGKSNVIVKAAASRATLRRGRRLAGAACLLWLLCAGPVAQATPQVQHWQTRQGVPVYFVPAREQPIVDLQISFDAGSARDGVLPGTAALCSRLLDQGAGGMNADQIAREFENRGAIFTAGVDQDSARLSLRSVSQTDQLQPVVENLIRILSRPDFPAQALERERRRMLIGIQARRQSPGTLAQLAFYRAVYGDHPYASPVNGEAAAVESIERAQLVAFHRRYYVTSNAVLTVVGDLDRAQAQELAESLFAELPAGTVPDPLPAVADLKQAQESLQAHPSSQTHIRLGQPGVRVSDEDRLSLHVGNYILGGGMVSRLFAGIREQRGLAYSIYSYFNPLRERGPFVIGMQTRSDQAPEALTLLRELLRQYISEGPGADEMEQARLHLVGRLPLQIDSNKKLLDYLSWLGRHGLPPDYLDSYNERIEAISAEQVRTAFRRWIHPDRLVAVLVGQPPEQSAETDQPDTIGSSAP